MLCKSFDWTAMLHRVASRSGASRRFCGQAAAVAEDASHRMLVGAGGLGAVGLVAGYFLGKQGPTRDLDGLKVENEICKKRIEKLEASKTKLDTKAVVNMLALQVAEGQVEDLKVSVAKLDTKAVENMLAQQVSEARVEELKAALTRYEHYWPRKIVMLFGAPGAGKGTQAAKMIDELGIPQLSTGDMLRDAVAAKSPVGMKAKAVMESGGLVSDEIVVGIIEDRIKHEDCTHGFILDGFPRTLEQALALDKMLAEQGAAVNSVLAFDVDAKLLEERICGRWMHKSSGRSYHVKFAPPKSMTLDAQGNVDVATMKDDETGEALYQRADDTADALKSRLASYNSKTVPILQHYQPAGIVATVDGAQSMEQVWSDVQKAMRS